MSAAMERLNEQGVKVWVHAGELRITAPKGWMSAERKAWLSTRKAELLAALAPDFADDRITCTQCANLANNGLCLAARKISAPGGYHPVTTVPHRCVAYA